MGTGSCFSVAAKLWVSFYLQPVFQHQLPGFTGAAAGKPVAKRGQAFCLTRQGICFGQSDFRDLRVTDGDSRPHLSFPLVLGF